MFDGFVLQQSRGLDSQLRFALSATRSKLFPPLRRGAQLDVYLSSSGMHLSCSFFPENFMTWFIFSACVVFSVKQKLVFVAWRCWNAELTVSIGVYPAWYYLISVSFLQNKEKPCWGGLVFVLLVLPFYTGVGVYKWFTNIVNMTYEDNQFMIYIYTITVLLRNMFAKNLMFHQICHFHSKNYIFQTMFRLSY